MRLRPFRLPALHTRLRKLAPNMPVLKEVDPLSTEQIAKYKLFARHQKQVNLMIDNYPGLLSIKDVTRDPWVVVYINEPLCVVLEQTADDYYLKGLEHIVDPGVSRELLIEDQKVLQADFGVIHHFKGPSINGEVYYRERYKYQDGDKTYAVVLMRKAEDER